MNSTENYHLNQWEATDRVLRQDFNADNVKIDAALEEIRSDVPALVLGTYTGDGAATRTITLGFTPRAVYVAARDGATFRYLSGSGQLCGGFALQGHPCVDTYRNRPVLSICPNGFQVNYNTDTSYYVVTNSSNTEYRYIALK